MCNAAKHGAGCNCGFGPPYPLSYTQAGVTEWSEEVLDNPALVTRGLSEMAWDDASIEAFLARYLELRNSDLPRNTIVSRIRELLGTRRKLETDVTEDWINVPLYRFGAPSVDGAAVEYSEGESFVGGGGWSVKVFGIGAGNTTSLQVNKSRTFVAGPGICKLVFIPIKLRVSRIAVYDGVRLVGRGIEAQVAPLRESGDEHLKRRGCRTLPKGSCTRGPAEHIDMLECLLSGDDSADIHRDQRSWDVDIAHEVSVTLMNFANVSALVSVKRTRRLELSFSLPAGHDYRAYLCPGITWWDRPA
jgi:hypothetical protein